MEDKKIYLLVELTVLPGSLDGVKAIFKEDSCAAGVLDARPDHHAVIRVRPTKPSPAAASMPAQ